jgi:hypothetical protein
MLTEYREHGTQGRTIWRALSKIAFQATTWESVQEPSPEPTGFMRRRFRFDSSGHSDLDDYDYREG